MIIAENSGFKNFLINSYNDYMKNIQDPEVYLTDVDNIFHQLRGHFIIQNLRAHNEFEFLEEPEKPLKLEDLTYKKPIQVSILEARMQKLQYVRLRRKGAKTDEEELCGTDRNLQSANAVGYYSLEQLMGKLSSNEEKEIDEKTWKQLSMYEKKEKLKEFLKKFKDSMNSEIYNELKKDVFMKLKEGRFENSGQLIWHKGSQKILEVKQLMINPSCFYWTE